MQRRLLSHGAGVLRSWTADLTEQERHPPTHLEQIRNAVQGAADCVAALPDDCWPSSTTVMKATGVLAASLLTLAVRLLGDATKAPTFEYGAESEASGGEMTASDSLWVAGAIVTLVIGLFYSLSCLTAAVYHCARRAPDEPGAHV